MNYRKALLLLLLALPAAFAQNPPAFYFGNANIITNPTWPGSLSGIVFDYDGASDLAAVEVSIANCVVHYEGGSFWLVDPLALKVRGPLNAYLSPVVTPTAVVFFVV